MYKPSSSFAGDKVAFLEYSSLPHSCYPLIIFYNKDAFACIMKHASWLGSIRHKEKAVLSIKTMKTSCN